MPESLTESNEIITSSQNHHSFFRSWLNKYPKTKLEFYSLIFGISGISLITFAICILIIISTTYNSHLTQTIDCTILNLTHTHIKLCDSYRCRIFNHCIPYICTIVFVRYNISYESKLYSLNSSCSYEPSTCLSYSHIKSEQIRFLKTIQSKFSQCCLHSLTKQPMVCQNLKSYSIYIIFIIICLFIGLILILIGIIFQLHLNDYFKSSHKHEKDFLDRIFSIHSSIERNTPVNYDILTQTISHQNTPSLSYQKGITQ